MKIASYVFFDIETTGLPYQERNQTKITELSFVAASRNDLEKASIGKKPYFSKLILLFNPQRRIHPDSSAITGLTNEMLKNAPIFRDMAETIISFLSELPKPVCLIAHNGNTFDYKILLAEFRDINMSLPTDLLCADSLIGFRRLHKEKYPKVSSNSTFEDSKGSDNWQDFNVSSEDWNEIDILCSSLLDMDPFVSPQRSGNNTPSPKKKENVQEKLSFKLTDLYERLLNKKVAIAHRAEDDCMMLLECVVAAKEFLIWTDKHCKSIHDIKPLVRYG
ncbi:unnamed protein product [Arctia plantaginis]|uniref:Exonuclease domain-containing protein n=1 Tax=Arctia plantaginis TaxID=874455 RepID=A0A8S0ZGR0_ARCPL|nr:unnamed protein product [Arctia plantaginis]CAB3247097.1 unnamed protein product [Arctia plantaginis]